MKHTVNFLQGENIRMVFQFLRQTTIFLGVVICFVLILLLPREMDIEGLGGIKFEASYPFTIELYKENIMSFIRHLKVEKGFGTTAAGTPLVKFIQKYFIRSLKIVFTAFFLAMIIGVSLGLVTFYLRRKRSGRFFSFVTAILTSIPDFFLFIAIQYVLITAMNQG